ncbi:MAG TPA: efflux transporter outer membrane subunit [Candidatus Dormibacteraeota bacterium]|nr:efflux transporter outer membrane subunit [Candidatus Dormibacteraeota bacterium]
MRRSSAAPACLAVAFVLALAGCAVGPDFVKPEPEMPPAYRSELAPAEAVSFADEPWFDVFHDATLRALIDESLASNYDLRTAAARVEQAQHQVGVTRSEIFPQVGYQGAAQRGKSFLGPNSDNQTFNTFLGAFNLAWELDVWGRIRRATEASEAVLYATDDVRRGVVLSLVSGVASAYFTLQELDLQLDIARRTTESFTETVQLFTRRYQGGVDSRLSVERAKAARATAAATIPQIEQAIVQQENAICILLGRSPGPVAREPLLTLNALPPQTPPGLPSELLRRRPDVLAAERLIESSNAQVGVAVANFFPRIGLTTIYGGQSSDLDNIVKTPGVVWAIAGSLVGPIFQGGRLTEAYRAQIADWEATKAQYVSTVLTALSEVSNALIAQQKLEGVRAEQQFAVDALRESVRLALLRYNGGLSTYFEVLEAQQQLFPAELALAQTDLGRILAVVDLYRSLGGGWQSNDMSVDPGFWPTGP